jgi:hypothetical protein
MPETPPRRTKSILYLVIPLLIIALPFGYSMLSSLFAQTVDPSELFLEKPDPKYTECVEDRTYMRFHHWELLRNVREEVVRYGKRGDVGLKGCTECHTSRERFCNQCHDAVSLYPDCFDCHYYP